MVPLLAVVALIRLGRTAVLAEKATLGLEPDETLIRPTGCYTLDGVPLSDEYYNSLPTEELQRTGWEQLTPYRIRIGDREPRDWPEFVHGRILRVLYPPRNTPGGQPVVGTRNVHAFTGRVI